MDRPLRRVRVSVARAAIARSMAGATESVPVVAGRITLREHQRDAIVCLRRVIAEFGGALLADAVGLGKTFVAAALVREAEDAVVICPAALRDMWRRALARAGAEARVCTYSALSRGDAPSPARLLVLDEAHHARNPATRRYASLARLSDSARVLALTATPIHNSRDDLAAVLALFLGARAWTMSDAELARCVVRREHDDIADVAMPTLAPLEWLRIADDEELLHAILALPPPVPPAGGGDGGALIALGLVRQWSSSRAALVGAIRRRLARAAGLGAALEAGFHPTAADLRGWTAAEDSVQLAFPSLMAAPLAGSAPLLTALRAHERALRDLLARSRASSEADDARAEHLRTLRRAHAGARIVAFSQFSDSVHAMYLRLARDGGVAALTARGARVAGGTLTRREALVRFAPRAMGARAPAVRDAIELLLTTDLLSEGLDLGDASVVVHLDLPWTPARMEQRVGRSCRLGAPHACTLAYAFAPPAAAETLLAVERRLRAKLAAAGRMAGIAGAILPGVALIGATEISVTAARERTHRIVSSWRDVDTDDAASDGVVATASAERGATLALIERDGRCVLAAEVGDEPMSTDPARILDVVRLIDAARDASTNGAMLERARSRATDFLQRLHAESAVSGSPLFGASSRRAALRRLARITRRAPLHRKAVLASLAASARHAIATPFGVGAEDVLGEIVDSPLGDEAWLRALSQFGALHGSPDAAALRAPRLLALIVAAVP